MAVVGALALGLTPSVSIGTQLLADEPPNSYFVRGTKIGDPADAKYVAWADKVLTATLGAHGGPTNVPYSGGFWPVSTGGFSDPTYGAAVEEGLESLAATIAAGGDTDKPVIVYGYSEGAVVVTEYIRDHPDAGNTYILIGNPNRPNGGILQRFNGFYIPILDIPFNGATPTDGDPVIDIAYRYDGWADFPKYPLNLLATANALLGIALLHGRADQNVTAETLADAEVSTHGNTTYYLLNSDHVPLLMPFEGLVADPVLDAIDRPLRALIELGYDRNDYGQPTQAEVFPALRPATESPDVDEVTVVVEPEEADDTEPVKKRRTAASHKRESTYAPTDEESDESTSSTPESDDTAEEPDVPQDDDTDDDTDTDTSDEAQDSSTDTDSAAA
jgi:pimeloyl-ACP methyl ester carboxylesterase